MAWPRYCECDDCETIRYGPTQGGYTFWQQSMMARAEKMKREQEKEDRRWIGIEPWMDDHDYQCHSPMTFEKLSVPAVFGHKDDHDPPDEFRVALERT
jgi:hypothetical protein